MARPQQILRLAYYTCFVVVIRQFGWPQIVAKSLSQVVYEI